MHRPTLVILALLSPATNLAAQVAGSWVQQTLTPRPFARERHAMVFDVSRNESVLFGGFNGAYMNDTWVLTPTGWIQRAPTTSPPARSQHAMAYDPIRQRTVLLGGTNGSAMTDVWEWDGVTWTQRATNVASLGAGGSATYDPLQGGVYYNRDAVNLLWNGITASTINVPQPMGASNCGMVFHAAAGGPLLKLGQYTMRFTPAQGWVELGLSFAFGVSNYAIAADPVHDRVFIQSGSGFIGSGSSMGVGNTWQWGGGGTWPEVSSAPPHLYGHTMVFDFGRGTFVMFGGHQNGGSYRDVTYFWTEAPVSASYDTYGTGCTGTLPQAPRLRPNPLWNATPILGGQFFAEVDQVPPNTVVGGIIGLSDSAWSSVPLPLLLDPFGMIGCRLLASAEAVHALGVANANGSVNWVTPIPATLALSGFEFFQQALALVPGANPAGVLFSNGGHGIVGN